MRPFPHTRRRFAAGLLLVAATGCASLFDPRTDDVVDPTKLNNAAGVATLLAGARRDFALAYVGAGDDSQEGIALTSGLMTDEYDSSDTFPTRQEVDQRNMDVHNTSLLGLYQLLHRARAAADQAAVVAQQYTPDDADTIGELQFLSGMVILSFAEDYCSGVPLSSLDGATLHYGTPQTTQQLYQAALDKFNAALGAGAGSAVSNAASVGKGRALLGLGQSSAAATAVAAVPTSFRMTTFHSEANGTITNGIWGFVNFIHRWSMSTGAGGGINFVGANDPRTPYQDTFGPGFDSFTHQFNQLLFPQRNSPVPIVTGIEARLIGAEAALNAGSASGALTTLNQLRSSAGLGPLSDAGNTAARVNQLFRERAFWLYSTDRRLGDLRRLIRSYGRTSETVFPTGAYYKGGVYGTDVNIPISFEERNNPNVGTQGPECLDRNP